MQKGTVRVVAKLDEQDRFVGLRITGVEPAVTSSQEIIESFNKLEGDVSLLVCEGSPHAKQSEWKDTMALHPEKELGVGSAFKLFVLKAVASDVLQGKRSWRDIIELQDQDQSTSSPDYKDWPTGSPVSLFGLAASMISKSDNSNFLASVLSLPLSLSLLFSLTYFLSLTRSLTLLLLLTAATDALIRTVGREAIERMLPPFNNNNRPFLSTRDFFVLKSQGNEDLLEEYRKSATEEERRKVLDAVSKKPLPNPADFPIKPTAFDVEWLFSVRELCGAIQEVHSLPVTQINPGLAKKDQWDEIAFKGGSEPGVVNLTTRLKKGEHAFWVSATWNSMKGIEETTFFMAYSTLIGYLLSKCT